MFSGDLKRKHLSKWINSKVKSVGVPQGFCRIAGLNVLQYLQENNAVEWTSFFQ